MDLMLTSFGLAHYSNRRRYLDRAAKADEIFYRMPPAAIAETGQHFLPDYATLLLADRVILDETTYDRLISGRHRSYGNVSLIAKTLHDEGFVRLENFDEVIHRNQKSIKASLKSDLSKLEDWALPLEEATLEWSRSVQKFSDSLRSEYLKDTDGAIVIDDEIRDELEGHANTWAHMAHGHTHSHHLFRYEIAHLQSEPKEARKRWREHMSRTLSEYLSYVNVNLLLANQFDAAFHDWGDFQPFYRAKFLRGASARRDAGAKIHEVNKLFSVSFPEFTFWKPATIIRALKDPRIQQLRQLVDDAVAGKIQFDREFAVRTLTEVLKAEWSIGKMRNLVSYATLPLDLIPVIGMPIQKATEEAIVRGIARKKKKDYRWFYLISELAERAESEDQSQLRRLLPRA